MLMRRRPLLRAAMVGSVGYAGYRAGRAATEAAPAPTPQPAPTPPPAAATAGTDRVEALTRLKGLLDAGVLSQEEFDAEKRRILRGE